MDPKTVVLIQRSWSKVVPIAPQAATLFYERLFTHDPSLRTLFKEDMAEQEEKLMEMLDTAVQSLDDLEGLVPVLQRLGKRHVAYGVHDEHYVTVGTALLETLSMGLGEEFTPPVEEAWREVYGVVAGVMMQSSKAYEQ